MQPCTYAFHIGRIVFSLISHRVVSNDPFYHHYNFSSSQFIRDLTLLMWLFSEQLAYRPTTRDGVT